MPNRTCSLPECEKPTRNKTADLCGMHYHRMYRHGSFDKAAQQSDVTASHGRRYRSKYAPDHPIAGRNGKVYVHRAVLYDAIGPGAHPCHWCSATLDWTPKGQPDCLVVDHLNGYGDDNRIENLVPSCARCNIARGNQARSDALRAAGWWSQHDTIARLSAGGRRPRVA